MRKLKKRLLNRFWKPVVAGYLKKPRRVHSHGLDLVVMPGVFHPGFFYSTRILAQFLSQQALKGKKILDLGCGSGLLALLAAKKGAVVTALDISEKAVDCTVKNAAGNKLVVEVIQSDLFEKVAGRHFDLIAVNPPYYKKPARNTDEMAWNAGADHEYFQNFFSQLKNFMLAVPEVYMILSEDCELKEISLLARSRGFRLVAVSVHALPAEKLTLFRIAGC